MSLGLLDEVATPARRMVRRRCKGCGIAMWDGGAGTGSGGLPTRCWRCIEAKGEVKRAKAKRLCCDCGDPAKRHAVRCAPCWKENELELRRAATARHRAANREHINAERRARPPKARKPRPARLRNRAKQNAYNAAYRTRRKAKEGACAS